MQFTPRGGGSRRPRYRIALAEDPGLILALLARWRVLGRLVARDAVISLQPPPEINIGTAPRAKRLMAWARRLAANGAAPGAARYSRDGILGHYPRYRLTAARCQKAGHRSRPLPQWRYGVRASLRAI